MVLDMLKLRRLPKRRYIPVKFPHPIMQLWIPTPDVSDIALEVLDVDRVEAYDCGVKADIRFSDIRAKVVGGGVGGEVGFGAVQGAEKRVHGFFIGSLGSGDLISGFD